MKSSINCTKCEYWKGWNLTYKDWIYYCGLMHLKIGECKVNDGVILDNCPLCNKENTVELEERK